MDYQANYVIIIIIDTTGLGIHCGKHISQLIQEQLTHQTSRAGQQTVSPLRSEGLGRGWQVVNRMVSACYPCELVKRTTKNTEFALKTIFLPTLHVHLDISKTGPVFSIVYSH